jgi:hypothetical protein
MKLYHGTSSRYLDRIKREGLKPRGRKRGNWEAHPSHPEAVYLTNSYAVFYANACAKGREDLVVLEIDAGLLNPFKFGPDEDFLEQAGRGRDDVPGDMAARNAWYKDQLHKYCDDIYYENSAAELSLQHLGNCIYFGNIPFSAITQIALINVKQASNFVMSCFDPSIILMNYKVCGPKYRNSLKWLFGYELEHDPLDTMTVTFRQMPGLVERPALTRDGITITNLKPSMEPVAD